MILCRLFFGLIMWVFFILLFGKQYILKSWLPRNSIYVYNFHRLYAEYMYTEAVWGFWTLGSIACVRQKKMGTIQSSSHMTGLEESISTLQIHEIFNQLLVRVTQLQES